MTMPNFSTDTFADSFYQMAQDTKYELQALIEELHVSTLDGDFGLEVLEWFVGAANDVIHRRTYLYDLAECADDGTDDFALVDDTDAYTE